MESEVQEEIIDVVPFSLDDDTAISVGEGKRLMSGEELERASRFRFGILRDRYIRGRGMVRRVLSRYLDISPEDLRFGTGDHGKPFLLEGSIHFNLSHSLDIAVLAVGQQHPLGIDIERFDREVDFDRLAERCFRESEWDRFRAYEDRAKAEAFFWLWTAKEARMKATGEGFRLEPKKIEIEFEGSLPQVCREPVSPQAYLSPVKLREETAACTVAALAPFRVRLLSASLREG